MSRIGNVGVCDARLQRVRQLSAERSTPEGAPSADRRRLGVAPDVHRPIGSCCAGLLHRCIGLPRVVTIHLGGGGLGNQLFDYAGARTLADRHGAELIIDSSALAGDDGRPFCLDAFNFRGSIRWASPGVRRSNVERIVRRLREDFLAATWWRRGDGTAYSDEFERLPARCIIRGHLLNPRFFLGNLERIKRDVEVVDQGVLASPRLRHWMPLLDRPSTVAVHVRRGDMLLPELDHLRVDGLERYMIDAMQRLSHVLEDPCFAVFSDDPDWCRASALFAGRRFHVISEGGSDRRTTLEDFVMMSRCRHIVMPNSAFSWWAALARPVLGYTFLPVQWLPSGALTAADMRLPGWIEP